MKAKHCMLGHVLGVLLVLCGSTFVGCVGEAEMTGDSKDDLTSLLISNLSDQIKNVNASISDLQDAGELLEKYIEDLNTELSDLQAQLDELESTGDSVSSSINDLKDKISAITSMISDLQAKDDELDGKITSLKEYVDGELKSSKDWVKSTFATLEQYDAIQTELSSIKSVIEQIRTESESAADELVDAIAKSEESMKSWVNKTLADGYYDIATIEGKLEYLETKLSGADATLAEDLVGQIKAQQDALEDAKEELTNAYEHAISTAIEKNGGAIDDKIAASVKAVQDKVNADLQSIRNEVKGLKDEIEALKGEIQKLEGQIASVEEQITSITSSLSALQEMDRTLESLIGQLEKRMSSLEDQLGSSSPSDPDDVIALQKEISDLKVQISSLESKDKDLDKQIAALQNYVDGEITSTKDWAESTFSTLEQYVAVQTEISSIRSLVEQYKTEVTSGYTEAIEDAIAEAEVSMKSWVNKTLADGYYDIATIEGKLTALETKLSGADATLAEDLVGQIKAQQDALEDAKEELTNAYEHAISAAIEKNGGAIDDKIAASVKAVQDKVNADLQSISDDIDELKAEIEALKGEIQKLEGQIASVEEQITSITSSLSALQEMDRTLESLIGQLENRMSSLEDQLGSSSPSDPDDVIALQKEISDLKVQISSLESNDKELEMIIDMLRRRVEDEIYDVKYGILYWAESTFSTLEQYVAVQTEISSIRSLVEQYKTEAIEDAIAEAEESMKSWVNKTLADGYYDIATIEGKLTALETKLSGADAALAEDLVGQIKAQQDALEDAKEELTKAYEHAISAAIEKNGGAIDDKIAASVKAVQDKVNADLQSIRNEVKDLKAEIEELRSQIESILGMVQSVVYMPTNMDGAVYVNASSRTTDISFKISPSSAVASLQNVWQNVLSIKYLTMQKTKAAPAMKMLPITSAEFDETIGTVTVTVDCKTIDPSFFTGKTSASAALFISDGRTSVSSDFVPMLLNISVDLTSQGTANCYIVSETGKYQFKATKGNSSELLPEVAYAEVLWESFGTDVTPEVGDLVSAVMYDNGNIYFKTADTFKEGNAVIAAKDASGKILWSWHIWLTDQPEEQVYYNNAGTMMDRNLGATSATPGDVGALGLLYQWGRKDPFLGSSSISESIEAESTIIWPSFVESDSGTGTIAYATANPTTFITRNSENEDWYYTGNSSTDNTRWTTSEIAKSIYDPCPLGWRVPDGGEGGVWSKAVGSSSHFNYTYDSTNKGMNFSTRFGSASSIWYPASGNRFYLEGRLLDVSAGGLFWSSSPNTSYSHNACIAYFNFGGNVGLLEDSSRDYGYSVRCIKEGTGGGSSDSGDSNDNNVKFVLPAQTATWTYTLDKNADAYLFNNTLPEATYNRTFADLTAEVDNPASKITLADLATADLMSIMVNGKPSTNAELIFDTAANNVDIKYTDFAWGKTYNVEAVYELPYSKVTVAFEFNTVNREAGEIDITLDPQTFELYKDILEEGDNRSLESMVQLLKDKNYLDADADAAEYLADYKANAPVMSGRKVVAGGADYITGETTSTGFQFDAADATNVYPKIYYANFPADEQIPTEMTYKAVITTWYGQVINISQDINIELPKYDYVHDPLWVKETTDYYYSQVMGEYREGAMPNIKTHALSSYSADVVDMLRAFKVVDAENYKLDAAALTAAGLVPDFTLEGTYGTGIVMAANILQYNDDVDYVDITAKLYLVNSNGSKVALPTSFDGVYAKYAEYRVRKPEPIADLVATPHTEYILDVKRYEIPVMKYFSLMENKLNVEPEYNHSLIDAETNNWTVGVVTPANGFESGKSVTDIYSLAYDWSNVEIPDAIAPYVTFDPATRTLTFDNTASVSLFEDVVVKIKLHIAHTWGTDEAILEITFPKNAE